MSQHYHVKYECQKTGGNLKYVLRLLINHKNLSCDGLLHYKFITQFAGERIFKIGEHLAKLRANWLIVSYAPFALSFYPQRCRTRWISNITCVLLTETISDRCYVNRQINVSLLSTNIKPLYTRFDSLTDAISE